jgi:hypothetical protein
MKLGKAIIAFAFTLVFLCAGCSRKNEQNTPITLPNLNRPIASAPSPPPVPGWDPARACGFLNTVPGLQTRGYKNLEDIGYSCSSGYKDVGETGNSSIAYYVKGDSTTATDLRVSLNAYRVDESKPMLNEFASVCDKLTKAATGQPLPKEARVQIASNGGGDWKAGNYQIKLRTEIWPTGLGRDLQFTILPPSN